MTHGKTCWRSAQNETWTGPSKLSNRFLSSDPSRRPRRFLPTWLVFSQRTPPASSGFFLGLLPFLPPPLAPSKWLLAFGSARHQPYLVNEVAMKGLAYLVDRDHFCIAAEGGVFWLLCLTSKGLWRVRRAARWLEGWLEGLPRKMPTEAPRSGVRIGSPFQLENFHKRWASTLVN